MVVLAAAVLLAACGWLYRESGDSTAVAVVATEQELYAAVIAQIVLVDNSFGGADAFDRVEVATAALGGSDVVLDESARRAVETAVGPAAEVVFVEEIDVATRRITRGAVATALVLLDSVRIDGDRATIRASLICGNLCGITVDYEASRVPQGWQLLPGQILAVS